MSHKGKEINEEERKIIIKLHKSIREIAQLVDKPRLTIQSIIDRFCKEKKKKTSER